MRTGSLQEQRLAESPVAARDWCIVSVDIVGIEGREATGGGSLLCGHGEVDTVEWCVYVERGGRDRDREREGT